MPHPMPNTIGTSGTRGTLWRGATNFGGMWSFGAQRVGFPFRGDQSPSFMARPSAWSVGRAGGAGDWLHGSWLVGFSSPDVIRWSAVSG
jgi:hypothetical protein